MINYVVRSEAHTIESTSGVQVTWHSIPAVHILSNTLSRRVTIAVVFKCVTHVVFAAQTFEALQ